MFHGHRHALIGTGLTLAGLAVADAALPESKALGELAGGLLVVAVAGYVTARGRPRLRANAGCRGAARELCASRARRRLLAG